MSLRKVRELTVLQKYRLTPNMLRIILGGDDLQDFPEGQESGYVKLLFPSGEAKPVMRSYTIRTFDAERLELTLDFAMHNDAVHEDQGPASNWAVNVEIGSKVAIDGPGAKKLVDMSAEWFFIAGDMTAIPAISANLEQLPANAKGYAVLEVLTEEDKQDLSVPEGLNIHWVVNSHPDQPNTVLLDKVKSLPWLDGVVNVWVASEFDAMRHLRHYFKKEKGVERGQIYASSYWKMGETDEGNKAAKKMDNDA